MSEAIVYVDTSQVREGKLPELKAAMKELAEFVEANEPRLASYSVYFSEDGRRVSIIHVSPDTAALETHMDVAGPRFARFAELLDLESIEIYGAASEAVKERARQKAEMLGRGAVYVHEHHAGFARLAVR